jgi:FKBP-type peptidyl-prolyl cis-trans isomerase
MPNNMKFFLLFFLAAILAVSCSNSKYPDYKESDNGLYFKLVTDEDGVLPNVGDYMKVDIQYITWTDSVFFDSKSEILPVWIPVEKPTFRGDIMEGLAMLSVGDSASFILRTDSFFIRTIGAARIPDFAAKDSMMYVNVKVLDIKSQDEFAQERQLIDQDLEVQYEQLRVKEEVEMVDYLKVNNINQKPTESGLIFIPVKNVTGPRLQIGQKVKCHYTGSFIDGQIFDSSIGMEPLEVVVGSPDLIDGFNEALLLMNVGSEAKAIIPSSIGFGKSEINSPIPPYATLVFEITVLSAE